VPGQTRFTLEGDESRATLIGDVDPGPWEENQYLHNEVLERSIEPWESLPDREENNDPERESHLYALHQAPQEYCNVLYDVITGKKEPFTAS
jgi:hypothetical protein